MPADIVFEDCEGYLLGVVSGCIENVEELIMFCHSVVSAVSSRSVKKMLLDMLSLEDRTSYHDGTILGEMDMVTDMARMGVRFASVHSPDKVGRHRLYETIFSIRSLKYKAFVEVDEAIRWLKV